MTASQPLPVDETGRYPSLVGYTPTPTGRRALMVCGDFLLSVGAWGVATLVGVILGGTPLARVAPLVIVAAFIGVELWCLVFRSTRLAGLFMKATFVDVETGAPAPGRLVLSSLLAAGLAMVTFGIGPLIVFFATPKGPFIRNWFDRVAGIMLVDGRSGRPIGEPVEQLPSFVPSSVAEAPAFLAWSTWGPEAAGPYGSSPEPGVAPEGVGPYGSSSEHAVAPEGVGPYGASPELGVAPEAVGPYGPSSEHAVAPVLGAPPATPGPQPIAPEVEPPMPVVEPPVQAAQSTPPGNGVITSTPFASWAPPVAGYASPPASQPPVVREMRSVPAVAAEAETDSTEGPGETPVASALQRLEAPSLGLSDGRRIELAAPAVLGRNPTAPGSHPDAVPYLVNDQLTSKTHLLFGADQDGAWVIDLHSTNGVWVSPRLGEGPAKLAPGKKTYLAPGARVRFGDQIATVTG